MAFDIARLGFGLAPVAGDGLLDGLRIFLVAGGKTDGGEGGERGERRAAASFLNFMEDPSRFDLRGRNPTRKSHAAAWTLSA